MEKDTYRGSSGSVRTQLDAKTKKKCFYFVFGFTNLVNILALIGVIFFLWQGCSTLSTVMAYVGNGSLEPTVVFADSDLPAADESIQAVFSETSEVAFSVGDSDIKVTANNMIVISVIYFFVALVLLIALIKNCSITAETT